MYKANDLFLLYLICKNNALYAIYTDILFFSIISTTKYSIVLPVKVACSINPLIKLIPLLEYNTVS